MPYKIVGMLQKDEAGGSEQKKGKQVSWFQLVMVMILGIVLGRLSVGACNAN